MNDVKIFRCDTSCADLSMYVKGSVTLCT